jgi:hypothetical protein
MRGNEHSEVAITLIHANFNLYCSLFAEIREIRDPDFSCPLLSVVVSQLIQIFSF